MRKFNKNNWKQKIDPAFDKLVKIYADFLTQLEGNSHEGRLNFTNDFIEPIIEKYGWQGAYSEDLKSHEDMFNLLKRAGALTDEEINLYLRTAESLESYDELLKNCFEMTVGLKNQESKQFYINKINSFKNNPEFKPDINSVDKTSLDFYSAVTSLLFHYLYSRLFEDVKESINEGEEEIEYFRKSNAMTSFLAFVLSSFSNIANQISIMELKDKISKGDDKSLFKAVTIDKSFLSTEDVKNRIIKAQLSGDADFFKKLGKAIADNPLKRVKEHGKTYSVIKLFWFLAGC